MDLRAGLEGYRKHCPHQGSNLKLSRYTDWVIPRIDTVNY
jgi:hypothetical protein